MMVRGRKGKSRKIYSEDNYGKRKEMSGMYTSDKKAYRRRNKIDDKPLKQNRRASEGDSQIRGIKGMVEKDAYCPDILIQVSAITAALNSFNKVLLSEHIRTCVSEDIREGKDETIDELVTVLRKLMK